MASTSVWVVNIRAVGHRFSSVTGWPPGSVGVWLGVFYSFIPTVGALKVDAEGRPLPAEFMCHMRSHLEDIAASLRDQGLPWLSRQSDLVTALAEVEHGRDCFVEWFDTEPEHHLRKGDPLWP